LGTALEVGQYVGRVNEPVPNEAVDLQAAQEAALGQEQKNEAKNMESLLHWAIEHSDPKVLAEQAAQVKEDEAITDMLDKKRKRVKELVDIMNSQPSEAQLMRDALRQLTAPDSGLDDKVKALQALQILVEPIDNANDLKGMNGIQPVVAALGSEMRAAAAYVLGTAASNNAHFQQDLLQVSPDVFAKLVALTTDPQEEVVVKGLYALAALVRNLDGARAAFNDAGGIKAVESVMMRQPEPGAKDVVYGMYLVRAKRKALALMMDLVQMDTNLAQRCVEAGLAPAMLALLRERDHDLQEKALEGMRTLLERTPLAGPAFRDAGASEEVKQLHILLYQTVEMAARSGAHDSEDHHYIQYLMGLCDQVTKLLQGRKPHIDHTEL